MKNALVRIFKKIAPKSLMGRTLLILITPMLILQTVMAVVFYEYHIEDRLQYSAWRTSSEISYIRTRFEKDNQNISFLHDFSLSLGRQYSLQNNAQIELAQNSVNECTLKSYIATQFSQFFTLYEPEARICELPQEKIFIITIPLDSELNLVLRAYQKEFLSGKWHFLPVWSLATGFLMALIAGLFLKNQIRPILGLSQALSEFGKGEYNFPFHSSGATEIKQAGFEFLKMRRRLNNLINDRTMMLAGISHDLRTILTRLKLELSLMPKDEAVNNLKSDVNHMNAILECYLNFIHSIKDEASQSTDIEKEINILIERYIPPNIQCHLKCTINNNITLQKNGFIRCILNLLSNAKRYGSIIHITAELINKNNQQFIRCIIEDNGKGVSPDDYEKIFDPFYSDNKSRTLSDNHGEQLGLGLSIIRNIARSKGGDVIPSQSKMLGGFKVTLNYII